jgi:LytR cell envelope-related transcriptional attenuator
VSSRLPRSADTRRRIASGVRHRGLALDELLRERYERTHIVGVSKIAYVRATPRCLDWRRDRQHTSANDYGSWAGPDAITFGREGKSTRVSGPYDNPAATLAASRSTGRALLAIVQEFGAVAGLAAVVGLVVLSALYVSHARDVKRLREWAGGAPEGLGPGIGVPGRAAGVPQPAQPQTAATASGAPASLADLRPATAAGASARRPVASQPVRPTPSTQRPITEPAASRTVPEQAVVIPPRRSQPWHSRIGARSAPVLVGLLAVGGVATYGVSQLVGRDAGDHSGKTQAIDNGLSRKPKRSGVAVKPGTVTVAVLNGTTVNGLAAALRDQIAAAGFKKGTINVFSDQQLAESVVEYAPGHLAEAKAVGRIVGISQREPVTANSRALAGDATVIVIAGADKAP